MHNIIDRKSSCWSACYAISLNLVFVETEVADAEHVSARGFEQRTGG